jgi:hypothetical protein
MIGQVTPQLRVVQGSINARVSSCRATWRPTSRCSIAASRSARNAARSPQEGSTPWESWRDLFITLAGVYQAPGGPDEDRPEVRLRGWQAPYFDDASAAATGIPRPDGSSRLRPSRGAMAPVSRRPGMAPYGCTVMPPRARSRGNVLNCRAWHPGDQTQVRQALRAELDLASGSCCLERRQCC